MEDFCVWDVNIQCEGYDGDVRGLGNLAPDTIT